MPDPLVLSFSGKGMDSFCGPGGAAFDSWNESKVCVQDISALILLREGILEIIERDGCRCELSHRLSYTACVPANNQSRQNWLRTCKRAIFHPGCVRWWQPGMPTGSSACLGIGSN